MELELTRKGGRCIMPVKILKFYNISIIVLLMLSLPTFAQEVSARPANSVFQAHLWDAKNGSVAFETGKAPDGTSIGGIQAGDWVKYSGVDFGTGDCNLFMATIALDASAAGKTFEIRIDTADGTIIGSLAMTSTGGWTVFQEQYASITTVTGVHDVYLVFPQYPACNMNWFVFGKDPDNETTKERDRRMAW